MEKEKARLDKWLWSVRLFKTRTLASKACQSGKVKINKRSTKASSSVQLNDHIVLQKNGIFYEFKVLKVIENRVGYPVAITCYQDLTSEKELNKFKAQYAIRHRGEFREKGLGRPTKRDRRDLEDFKDFDIDFEDYFD
ncbi:MAG: RNA-binding S4 domain-containing protein [Flavobacteriales bacterium]